jgi:hypothetical protein
MKKNKMMRLASVLLVLTLLSTSIISGTFAKYVSTGKASDTARVAKWGVVVNTSGTLYSNAYYVAKNNYPASPWSSSYGADNITVASRAGEDNVVAPGTTNYYEAAQFFGLSFGITGTPEVATKIQATITTRDVYLSKGYSYAVMIPEVVSTDSVDSVGNFNGKDGTSTTLFYRDTDKSFYPVVRTTSQGVVSYSANGKKLSTTLFYTDLYLINDEVTLSSDYYPVVYRLESGLDSGTKYEDGSVNAGSTAPIAETIMKRLSAETMIGNSQGEQTGTDPGYTVTANSDGTTVYTVKNPIVFDANIDLATSTNGPLLGDENLTWEWDFDDSGKGTYDKQDTILGDMIEDTEAGLAADVVVVAKTASATSYSTVSYTKDGSQALLNNTVIASLKTQFDIELTVTQVD